MSHEPAKAGFQENLTCPSEVFAIQSVSNSTMSSNPPPGDVNSPDSPTCASEPAVRQPFSPPTDKTIPPLLRKLLAQGSPHLDKHGTPVLDIEFQSIGMKVTQKEWKCMRMRRLSYSRGCKVLGSSFSGMLPMTPYSQRLQRSRRIRMHAFARMHAG